MKENGLEDVISIKHLWATIEHKLSFTQHIKTLKTDGCNSSVSFTSNKKSLIKMLLDFSSDVEPVLRNCISKYGRENM